MTVPYLHICISFQPSSAVPPYIFRPRLRGGSEPRFWSQRETVSPRSMWLKETRHKSFCRQKLLSRMLSTELQVQKLNPSSIVGYSKPRDNNHCSLHAVGLLNASYPNTGDMLGMHTCSICCTGAQLSRLQSQNWHNVLRKLRPVRGSENICVRNALVPQYWWHKQDPVTSHPCVCML